MNTVNATAFWLYTYSARGIQEFVFSSEKLRGMIGASQLIEHQAKGRFEKALQELCPDSYEPPLSQAAGSGRVLFRTEEAARTFAAHWPFLCQFDVPGLTIVQAVVAVEQSLADAIVAAEQVLTEQRSRQWPELPVAGPLVAREATTGFPIGWPGTKPTEAGQSYATALREKAQGAANDALRRLIPGMEDKKMEYLFEDIAGPDNAYLALVHADGNGLGALVMQLMRQLQAFGDPLREAEAYRGFCAAVDRASKAALNQAAARIVDPVPAGGIVPLRPLICAGDDLTVVLRAGLAAEFVQDYATAFEAETKKEFGTLEGFTGLTGLTCGAGVVIMKKNYPIAQAYALCEDLCAQAKQRAGRECSSVIFTRITTPLTRGSYEGILEHELKADGGGHLTLNPYHVGTVPADHLPKLADLLELVEVAEADNFSLGPVRKFLTAAREDRTTADDLMWRLGKVQGGTTSFEKFRRITCLLNGTSSGADRWWWRAASTHRAEGNPFDDMHDLIAARRTGKKDDLA